MVVPSSPWPPASLLSRLSGRTRDALLALGTPISYHPRQVVFRQHTSPRHALLVVDGFVKHVVTTECGAELPVILIGPGDLSGEMSLLERRTRCADVVACVPVHGKLIPDGQLVDFLNRTPAACLAVTRSISARLHAAQQRHAEFVVGSPHLRVARVLLDVSTRLADPVVPLCQGEIAALAGCRLRTGEKALQDMENRGLVRRGYRQIVVTDEAGLRQFSELGPENPY